MKRALTCSGRSIAGASAWHYRRYGPLSLEFSYASLIVCVIDGGAVTLVLVLFEAEAGLLSKVG
jgi:hypothetical protein